MKLKTTSLLFIALALIASPVLAHEAKDLAGQYELTGMMEMAGLLALRADQKYQAGFSYGAADWVEEGTWKPEGDGVVLSGSHFKIKNGEFPLLLPAGTHFSYKDGRMTATDPAGGKISFVDPNKTPSNRKKTGEAGEGRMLVKGKVVKIDGVTMVVKIKGECVDFLVAALAPEVRKAAKKGATLDTEIPYSAIIGGESCPVE